MTDPTARIARDADVLRAAAQRLHDDAADPACAQLVPAAGPSPRGGAGPLHEQQVRVPSSLHDAGAALRSAVGHCARAAGTLAATMEPIDDLSEPPRGHGTEATQRRPTRRAGPHAARATPSDLATEPWTTSTT